MIRLRDLCPSISLRWLSLSMCLITTAGTMGLVGYLSYRSGEKTVEALAQKLLQENSKQVVQDTNYYLKFIRHLNHPYTPLLLSETGELENLEQIHRYFIQQQKNFPVITSMIFARPNGEIVMTHHPSPTETEAGQSSPDNPQTITVHGVREDGTLGKPLRTLHNVNVRDDLWYRQAVATGKSGWSQPSPTSIHRNRLSLNAYTPFYEPAGTLQGVFAASLSLEQLNQFLAERAVGEQGEVFIMQRDGLLIANSTGDPLSDIPNPPLLRSEPKTSLQQNSGLEMANPLIYQSTQQLKTEFGSLDKIQSLQSLSIAIDGKPHYLQAVPFQNPYGFDWLVVSVVPQSEFVGTLQANRNRTLVIGGGLVLSVTALTMLVAHQITKSLRRLNEASQVIAEGNWQAAIPEDCLIQELNALARSYNQMGAEIQESYTRFWATLGELKATNQRLEQFLEAIPVGIGILGADGQPCYVNQRAVEFLGQGMVGLESLEEMPEIYQLYQLGTNQLYPYQALAIVRALQGETASNDDVEVHLRDRVVPLETWGSPIYNAEGEIEYALVAFQDITERKRAERQLWELSERLELSLAAGQIGSWEWDFQAETALWDQRMYKIYAVTAPTNPETTLKIWYERIHPQERDRVYQLCRKAISEQTSLDTEFRIIHPDGSIRYIKSYGLIRRNSEKQSYRMIGVNFDITELKTAQRELEQANAELIQANRLKDEFLATMNHELRTPLNGILGMTEALEQETLGAMTPRQHKTLQVIRRSGNHLLEIVNDILDLSKLESGKKELRYSQTCVLELCQSAIALVQSQADQKQVQLKTQLSSPLLKISVEERLLRQVLINLLSNAVKFTPQGGKITLEATFPTEKGDNWMTFAVRDTGIGIAQENLDKIFQPFVQIDSALNRKYEGTGIGLSLVKRIVELHGGQVRVTSQEQVGSCFYLDLPCVITSQAAGLEDQSFTPETSPLILVVEESEAELMTIHDYLEARGYHLLLAQTPAEAVAQVDAHAPDLMILTWDRSDQAALSILEAIRHQHPTPVLPCIAIAPQPRSEQSCWGLEAVHCLNKPLKLKALANAILEAL